MYPFSEIRVYCNAFFMIVLVAESIISLHSHGANSLGLTNQKENENHQFMSKTTRSQRNRVLEWMLNIPLPPPPLLNT